MAGDNPRLARRERTRNTAKKEKQIKPLCKEEQPDPEEAWLLPSAAEKGSLGPRNVLIGVSLFA